jgi:DNA-binding CsgD family transcriptional regulator
MRFLLPCIFALPAVEGPMNIHRKQQNELPPSISMHFPEQRLFSTLDDSGIGVVICDRRLRYKALNQSLAVMHNVPIEAHLGHSLLQVLGGFADKVVPLWETVLSTGRPVGNLEIVGQFPESSDVGRWVHSFFPLKDRSGRVTHAGCFVIEVVHLPVAESLPSKAARNTISQTASKPLSHGQRKFKQLSSREQQILQLLAEGNSNKQVSSTLNISTRTVETYRARLMLKLQASSFAHLVHYAIRNRIITL